MTKTIYMGPRSRLRSPAAEAICDVAQVSGATWLDDGGAPKALTSPAETEAHRWPEALPGTRSVFSTTFSDTANSRDISLLNLDGGEPRVVVKKRATGTLLYREDVGQTAPLRRIVAVSRQGAETELPVEPAAYEFPRVSPDGQHILLAVQRRGSTTQGTGGGLRDIWSYTVSVADRGRRRRATAGDEHPAHELGRSMTDALLADLTSHSTRRISLMP